MMKLKCGSSLWKKPKDSSQILSFLWTGQNKRLWGQTIDKTVTIPNLTETNRGKSVIWNWALPRFHYCLILYWCSDTSLRNPLHTEGRAPKPKFNVSHNSNTFWKIKKYILIQLVCETQKWYQNFTKPHGSYMNYWSKRAKYSFDQ